MPQRGLDCSAFVQWTRFDPFRLVDAIVRSSGYQTVVRQNVSDPASLRNKMIPPTDVILNLFVGGHVVSPNPKFFQPNLPLTTDGYRLPPPWLA